MSLNAMLMELEDLGEPINVGLIGAGYMGSGILNIIEQMKGIRVVVLADRLLSETYSAFGNVGVGRDNIVCEDDLSRAEEAIGSGKRVVTKNFSLPAQLPSVHALVDGTSSPKIGAPVSYCAVVGRKHVVSANIEADVTIGYVLKTLADSGGVVYTAIAGDEPAVIKEMFDHASALGFEVIAGGKGKNNPLDVAANPETVAVKVPEIGISASQVASFVDGSKTAVEMACTANATGLVPDVRGMHGPKATLADLPEVFRLKSDGGILDQQGVVDYVVGGGVDPGVFLVISTDNVRLRSDLNYLKVGSGPNYVLYHPYHLWFIDAAMSVARAVLKKEATIAPEGVPVAEVIAVAKRDLDVGESLDGVGGYTVYGTIEKGCIARKECLLPFGLSEDAKVIRSVRKGSALTYDDVSLDDSFLSNLRGLQNNICRGR